MNDISGQAAEQQDKPVRATLKWFNSPKGFGFVVPDGESIDAFLHVTTLQKAGFTTISEGASLICCLERGPKGALVTEVVEIFDSVPAEPVHDAYDDAKQIYADGEIAGQIKWYNAEKGFGFIIPDDGNPDIFIHQACLDQHHLKTLDTGQRVAVKTRIVVKGSEAVSIRLTGP